MNKFCTNCGHELKTEEKFCPSCGFNTESVNQAKESVSNTQNVNSYQNTNHIKMQTYIKIRIMQLLVMMI